MKTKAWRQGARDGAEWAREQSLQELKSAPQPGQLGADEGLINGLGLEATAKLLGVKAGGRAWSRALAEYSRAWESEVAREVASYGGRPSQQLAEAKVLVTGPESLLAEARAAAEREGITVREWWRRAARQRLATPL